MRTQRAIASPFRIRARWAVPLAALLAVLPLSIYGPSCGHDFDFHVLNWLEVASQWHQGILYPHWAASAAYGAGEPRFVFYPPLSWMLDALLGLALPWSAVPAAYTFLVLCGCGLSMHRLAREWASPDAALVAALLYAVNPYMLFTAYERTAYAELMAAAWLPLLFLGILRARVTVSGIALPVALLWLTNAPAAVMGCYALCVLALVRLAWSLACDTSRTRHASSLRGGVVERPADCEPTPPVFFALKAAAGTLLGLALAAFYIVPAAYERRWVEIQMAIIPGMRIQDSFLFGHTADPDHDRVLWTASWIAVFLFLSAGLATIAISIHRKRGRGAASPRGGAASGEGTRTFPGRALPSLAILLALGSLAVCILLLQLPLSLDLWNHAPELRFLQFPWRWLAVLSVATALLLAFAIRGQGKRKVVLAAALLGPLALAPAGYALFHQDCDPEDTVAAQMQLFRSGSGPEPTDEYTPAGADNDALKQAPPVASLTLDTDGPLAIPAPIQTSLRTAERWRLILNASRAQLLVLRLRDYPAWRVRINGALVSDRPQRDDGLMALPIAPGQSAIDIRYAATPDQRAGEAISALALLALLLMERRRLRSFIIKTDAPHRP